jgi:hypothetical protein
MSGRFQRRGLRRAAQLLGGEGKLCDFLQVSAGELSGWLGRSAPVPEALFRKVIDLLADMESRAQQPPPPIQRPAKLS